MSNFEVQLSAPFGFAQGMLGALVAMSFLKKQTQFVGRSNQDKCCDMKALWKYDPVLRLKKQSQFKAKFGCSTAENAEFAEGFDMQGLTNQKLQSSPRSPRAQRLMTNEKTKPIWDNQNRRIPFYNKEL